MRSSGEAILYADQLTDALLGVPFEAAVRQLEAGVLRGTVAEAEVRMLRNFIFHGRSGGKSCR